MKSTSKRNARPDTLPMMTKGRGLAWTPDLQLLLDRRLNQITERCALSLRSISASLEDVNGPRGGVDKRCRVNVTLEGHGQVTVCATAPKIEVALTRAVDRARAIMLRKLQVARTRTNERGIFQDGLLGG